MSEGENFQEQYRHTTPQELNLQLSSVYDMIPATVKHRLPRFLRDTGKAYEHDWDPFIRGKFHKKSELNKLLLID